ncbi:H/ACA ribonucleoprotein complex subunit CBF5 [Dictyocoela muelleri]|nr:H/ACA ribonucleoprotein complex subunit CBF5 [Dictyocoela muelleri]
MSFLLRDLEKMNIKAESTILQANGNSPEDRPIDEYLKYGVLNLDKPVGPSSHEVVTWVKKILNTSFDIEKTGHCGTLDPNVSGVLLISLNRATRMAKLDRKVYICVIEFENDVDENKFRDAVEFFKGKLLQRPPLMCAVKRNLRIREIFDIEVIEFTHRKSIFKVECQAGTYIRTLCIHIGLKIGIKSWMSELRRIKSGNLDEKDSVTLHDLLDALYCYKTNNDEKYLRKIIKPIEDFIQYPRIIVKDSCVEAICHGAQLSVKGILRYDNFKPKDQIVLVTTKGEAIAICEAEIHSNSLQLVDSFFVCKTVRVIMERGLYKKIWSIKKDFDILSD